VDRVGTGPDTIDASEFRSEQFAGPRYSCRGGFTRDRPSWITLPARLCTRSQHNRVQISRLSDRSTADYAAVKQETSGRSSVSQTRKQCYRSLHLAQSHGCTCVAAELEHWLARRLRMLPLMQCWRARTSPPQQGVLFSTPSKNTEGICCACNPWPITSAILRDSSDDVQGRYIHNKS
jgi:hypothetical protein